MKHKHLRFGSGFKVAITNRRSQAAQMVIAPGGAEGDPNNRHRGADQWLYVVDGTGVATLNGKRVELRPGSLLLIEQGDRHEIRNNGKRLLKTLNLYSPPAYTPAGNPRSVARA